MIYGNTVIYTYGQVNWVRLSAVNILECFLETNTRLKFYDRASDYQQKMIELRSINETMRHFYNKC